MAIVIALVLVVRRSETRHQAYNQTVSPLRTRILVTHSIANLQNSVINWHTSKLAPRESTPNHWLCDSGDQVISPECSKYMEYMNTMHLACWLQWCQLLVFKNCASHVFA